MAADEPPFAELASGEGSAAVGSSPSSEALSRLLSEFNLSEFLALANRVIDEGDLSSMEIIADLKRRWIERFGDSHSHPSMDVRLSSSRTLAPFRLITVPCRLARRIPRLPTSEQMRAYLEPPPAVSYFPVPLLALPPPSTMAAPPSELNFAVATLAPPSDCTELESSLQDPDLFPPSIPDAPPSLQDSPPSKRVECQPQSSIENQQQYSMFSMDRTTLQDPALLRPSIHGMPPSCMVISLPDVWSASRNLPLRVSRNIPCLAWIDPPRKIQHCCGLPFMACHLPCTVISLPNVWIISRNLPYLAWIHIWTETCIIYRRLLSLHGHHLQPLWTKETWLNHQTYSLVMFR
ncbi:hypothetical protein Salat_0652900 [Sesamum alatum]|uniref:Uncharacterized protein n=1 Tax=Sesamum alatum TaxID=300844 RepID=A0AAE2CUF2_9LAMI|nr:hypothetical protein Salat_0652900 [Sesamum alatum]